MLSARIIAGRGLLNAQAATVLRMSRGWEITSARLRKAQFHATRLLQEETVKVPQMAESITEGTLKSWSKQVGDTVAADEEVATIETDKIDVSVNAPKSGKIVKLLANEEDTVTVGQDLFVLEPGETGESPAPPPPKQEQPAESQPKDEEDSGKLKDTQEPKPQSSGKEEKPQQSTPPKEKAPSPKSSKPDASKPAAAKPPPVPGTRSETRVKMNRMRLRIAERLKESQNAAASLTTFNEIDMSSLMDMRKRYKDAIFKDHDIKLGFKSA